MPYVRRTADFLFKKYPTVMNKTQEKYEVYDINRYGNEVILRRFPTIKKAKSKYEIR